MSYSRVLLLIALLAVVRAPVRAQELYTTDMRPARGFMPTADQVTSPIDSIDPVSGKLHVQIPLGSLPRGRAGLGFDVDLLYDSHIYDIIPSIKPGIPTEGNPDPPPRHWEELAADSATGGWTYNFQNYVVELEEHAECAFGDMIRWRLRVGLPDGSMHIMHLKGFDNETNSTYSGDGFFEIRPDGSKDPCSIKPAFAFTSDRLTYYSADGSYLKLEFQPSGTPQDWTTMTWWLYFPDGRRVVFNGSDGSLDIYDANNNRVRIINGCHDDPQICDQPFTAILDEADRAVQIDYGVESTAIRTRDIVTAPSPGPNDTMTWAIDRKLLKVGGLLEGRRYQVTFDPPEGEQWQTNLVDFSMMVVEYVQLPLASPGALGDPPPDTWNSYAFGYSDNADNGYGELDEIRMPSGALYEYDYYFETSQPAPPWPTAELIAHDNTVKEKRITHDGLTDLRWTYTFAADSSIFKNENGGTLAWETKYVFEPKNNPSDWKSGLVYRIEEPNGAVRKRLWEQNKTYGLRNASAYKTPNNPYIRRETVTDGTSLGSPSTKTAVTAFTIDKNGNPLTRTSYDWVDYAGLFTVETGTVVRRQQTMSYYVAVPEASTLPVLNTPSAYWQPHTLGPWPDPTSARRLDAVLRQTISPDGTTVQAVSEWEYSSPQSPYTTGNVTAEKRWDSVKDPNPPGTLHTGNAQVLTRSYDAYGNLTDVYEPDVRTRLQYPAQGTLLEGFLLGQADHALGSPEQRSWQFSWNSNGTAVTTKTDLDNALSTTFTYDVIGRQTSRTEAGLRWTQTTYDDAAWKVTTKRDLFTLGDGKVETITHYDELGRVELVQTSDGAPLLSDTEGIKVSSQYLQAEEGLRVVTSTPYRETSDTTLEWSCVQHDRLGRVSRTSMFTGTTAPTDCNATTSRTGTTETQYNNDITKVIEVADPVMIREYRRDALGRLVEVTEDPGALNYVTTYAYDALDNLTQVVQAVQTRTFTYSSLSRLLAAKNVTDPTHPHAYTADGRLAQLQLGNTLYDTRDYRTPGTPTQFKLGTTLDGNDVLQLQYDYPATQNNGNLQSHSITNGSTTWTQTLTYDPVNRLATAVEANVSPGMGFSQTFGYDQYGNAWVEGGTNLSPVDGHEPQFPTNFDTATNRIQGLGVTYDAAGNQTTYSPYTLGYDAENRTISMESDQSGEMTMAYDGDGRRVTKTWRPNGGSPVTTFYVYDATGQLAAEYSTAPGTAGTSYPFADLLGSVRGVANSTGSLTECYDYLPFGRLLASTHNNRAAAGCYPSADPPLSSALPQKFTGKERDGETALVTNLDYFGARYYSGAQGRFTSPDPGNVSGLTHMDDPQSWNGYSYVRNNPLKFTDPDGYDYRVCEVDSNNQEFNCGTITNDKEFEKYGKSQGWTIKRGALYDNSGKQIGTANWFNGDKQRSDIAGAQFLVNQTGPVVNALAGATLAFVGGAMVVEAAPLVSSASQITALELGPNIGARLLPTGMTTAYFGQQVMKWGTGNAAAVSRIGQITLQQLQAAGLTRQMAVSWYQFYSYVAKMSPANPSAAGRAQLMKAVVDLFD